MLVSAFAKILFGNPRNPNYLLAWAVLTFAILVIVFLAMELWTDLAIVAGALCVSALLMLCPRIPFEDDEE